MGSDLRFSPSGAKNEGLTPAGIGLGGHPF